MRAKKHIMTRELTGDLRNARRSRRVSLLLATVLLLAIVTTAPVIGAHAAYSGDTVDNVNGPVAFSISHQGEGTWYYRLYLSPLSTVNWD